MHLGNLQLEWLCVCTIQKLPICKLGHASLSPEKKGNQEMKVIAVPLLWQTTLSLLLTLLFLCMCMVLAKC